MEKSIEYICRICLNEPDDISLNIHDVHLMTDVTIAKVIESIAWIEIGPNSTPNIICESCWADLQIAYNIQLQCQAADRRLKAMRLEQTVEEELYIGELKIENPLVCEDVTFDDNDEKEDVTFNSDQSYTLEIQAHRSSDETTSTLKQFSYTCEICGKGFNKRHNLRIHVNLHGEKKYECRFCARKFATKQYLRSHERTHTKEKPYACDLCDKKYSFQIDLARHKMGTHTNTFSCCCEFCGKGFTKKSNLVIHERLHTGEWPHSCDDCGKTFAHPASYKKHLIMHRRTEK